MHAAHGIADDQAPMPDPETFGDQAIVRLHMVVVSELRELRLEPVRRLRRRPGAKGIRQDDEIFGGIQQLAGTEQLARELGCQLRGTRTTRAVQHQDGLALGIADRRVAEADLGQHFAGVKAEIAGGPDAGFRREIVGSPNVSRHHGHHKQCGDEKGKIQKYGRNLRHATVKLADTEDLPQ